MNLAVRTNEIHTQNLLTYLIHLSIRFGIISSIHLIQMSKAAIVTLIMSHRFDTQTKRTHSAVFTRIN